MPTLKVFKAHQFAHAQPAGVQHFQHRAVAQAQRRVGVGRFQQRLHLRFGQGLGHPQRLLGRLQAQRRVGIDQAFPQRPAEIALEDREAPVRRGRLGHRMARREVAVQVRLRGRMELAAALHQPLLVQRQVAAVGGERVARQTLLQPEGIDEGVDLSHGGSRAAGSAARTWALRWRASRHSSFSLASFTTFL
jgi:hypothetical protein